MSRRHEPVFTYLFVTVCTIVFFVGYALPESLFMQLVEEYSVRPASFMDRQNFVSLFSYMFLHINLQHLVSNMFVFLSVGRAVESEIGGTKFGLVFVGSGMASGYAHVITNQASTMSVIGASGAVFGAIALLLLLMPFKFTPALFIPLPGVLLGLGMLAIEVTSLLYANDINVAHDIHLYGFLAGGIGAFGMDYNRAMRGLLVSVLTLVALYYVFFYFDGLVV
ncbi:rhomboid family intramembrane serine protease [Candidatus Bathyarchaeota archaeon]|jgi:membrane associated rhomboid family serine protease|nr:rhomboid family intramembrane serine protease [Candidatus Bathyarchaeota archaeon]MBT4320694.1 rhomboid family intramembrane serine protease [Candidatus Bathyarchaeota archaeon]MBT4423748.1 rhomboid family intramembrane serine protease [Candidatus Bathyarchaeota archaeon]MBT6605580.1 rhomboid family intramembrane serine protease [Candidatus Bathyarchaeota archaeon]MBT7186847.1 rhomboid family intramembrane serine protease [Candidatus Bathyarchaeota archaeon]